MRTRIIPYKMGSKGSKAIKDGMVARDHSVLQINDVPNSLLAGTDVSLRIKTMYINWGKTIINQLKQAPNYFLLNNRGMEAAKNKLEFFQVYSNFNGIRLPEYTTDPDTAIRWMQESRSGTKPVLLERHKLSSHSGDGIRVLNQNSRINLAPLYVRYVPKQDEYRVHFFKLGNVYTKVIQQKRAVRNHDSELLGDVRFQVRNHASGWIYSRENVNPPTVVLDQVNNFISVTPLDFGAIDIIYNNLQDKAYILEVNTAPGLEGKTQLDYVHIFNYMNKWHDYTSVGPNFSLKLGAPTFVPLVHSSPALQDEEVSYEPYDFNDEELNYEM